MSWCAARSTSSTSRRSTPRCAAASRPRIKRLSEYIGESYFDYLAGLPDLVLLMDESHRYRASAGVRAINELKPILGLELTATPFVETSKGAVPFKNVILDYPLGRAMADGFVKGAGSRHAQELQPGRHVAGGDRAPEAGRRRAPAREREGRAGDLRPRDRQPHRQAVPAGDRARHDPRRASCCS